jgi:NAD(P)-dependent dehydrogenase (short-subunit alcohol dehydrogenase family)
MASTGVVLVTGAASGIGRATVAALAATGFSVVGGVHHPRDTAAGMPTGVRLTELDVTNPAHISRVVRELASYPEPIVGLVNNAGLTIAGPVEALPLAEWRHQLEVNLVAPIALVQALLPELRKVGGRIVMIGSLSAHVPLPFYGSYAASKAALAAATAALRMELAASDVHVSLVEPGMARTRIWRRAMAGARDVLGDSPSGERYSGLLTDVERNNRLLERLSVPPESVGRVVVRALTDRRPRARYRAAYPPAAWALRTVSVLPAPIRESIVRATLPALRRRGS